MEENGTAPAVEEVVVEETPVETDEVLDAPTVETADEEAPKEEVAEEATEEAPAEEVAEVVEPVTFDTEQDVTALAEQVAPILEKYEIPQEVQAVIDAYKAKAETSNEDVLGEYSVYGTVDEVKSVLDDHSLLIGSRETESGTRPNTDQFAEKWQAKSSPENDILGWIHYDAARQPSLQYQGLNRFQENIVNELHQPGDTAADALARYETFIEAMRNGALPETDIPSFIPQELHGAFNSLPKMTRDEIADLADDTGYDQSEDRARKLSELKLIQKGLDSERRDTLFIQQRERQEAIEFNQEIHTAETNFFNAFRNEFSKDIQAIKFVEDPKLNALYAAQNRALLEQAFDDGPAGEQARQDLMAAGVKFDAAESNQLLKNIETSLIDLTRQKRAVKPDGTPLDPIAYNKAAKEFEKATRQITLFGKNVLDQMTRFVSTGTADDIEKRVAKVKIAPKARAVATKSTPSAVKKPELVCPHPYGSQEYYKWWAEQYGQVAA